MKSLSALHGLLIASLSHLVASVHPHVNLTYAQYVGYPMDPVTQWLGMRYAIPPIRRMRFSPPAEIPDDYNRRIGLGDDLFGAQCIPVINVPEFAAEDCLFINVFAPTDASSESKLPVYVYIQEEAFDSETVGNINGTGLVEASKESIVVVTFNYRLGPFGFLTGYDAPRFEQAEGLRANNGFKDQQMALKWVQKYITNFGGDPNHVVLAGSGASLSWHLTAFDGQDQGLFHAVMLSSPSWTQVPHYRDLQEEYEDFIRGTNCQWKGSGEPESICLQLRISWETIRHYPYSTHVLKSVPWGPVIDDQIFKRTPFDAFRQGLYVKVPTISGDTTDSSIPFYNDQVTNWLLNRFPFLRRTDIGEFYAVKNTTSWERWSDWQEAAARVYGDVANQCPALYASLVAEENGIQDSYNYRYNVGDPDYSSARWGVPYGMETWAIFGPSNLPEHRWGAPSSYSEDGNNSKVVDVVRAYWISFIRTFNPNTFRYPGSAEWVRFKSESKERLRFDDGGKTSMEPVGQELWDVCDFLYRYRYP
ncbi:Alpha/Beta hydrolase protein [Podospora fimiseda]|uniref:Alpha/Beta hydrolase protein n=1 Tax=Podospora fimiseda TaxID=252190 RepID=A0AAN7BJT8_9PEZI|nr:Alpha/Beta hydrolase protein [Podospora fimiseda]